MNRELKKAWISLVCMAIGFIAAVIVLLMYFWYGSVVFGFTVLTAGAGWAVSEFICMFLPKDKGKVIKDERDIKIERNALFHGLIGVCSLMFIVCMVPPFVLGFDVKIGIIWLWMICIGCLTAFSFFYSLTIVIDYHWEDPDVQ